MPTGYGSGSQDAPSFDEFFQKIRSRSQDFSDDEIKNAYKTRYNADPVFTSGPSFEEFSSSIRKKAGEVYGEEELKTAYDKRYGAPFFTDVKRAVKKAFGETEAGVAGIPLVATDAYSALGKKLFGVDPLAGDEFDLLGIMGPARGFARAHEDVAARAQAFAQRNAPATDIAASPFDKPSNLMRADYLASNVASGITSLAPSLALGAIGGLPAALAGGSLLETAPEYLEMRKSMPTGEALGRAGVMGLSSLALNAPGMKSILSGQVKQALFREIPTEYAEEVMQADARGDIKTGADLVRELKSASAVLVPAAGGAGIGAAISREKAPGQTREDLLKKQIGLAEDTTDVAEMPTTGQFAAPTPKASFPNPLTPDSIGGLGREQADVVLNPRHGAATPDWSLTQYAEELAESVMDDMHWARNSLQMIDQGPIVDPGQLSPETTRYFTPTRTSITLNPDDIKLRDEPGAVLEDSRQRTLKRMQAAAQGKLAKRAPVTLRLRPDGPEVIDGNGTVSAAQAAKIPVAAEITEIEVAPQFQEMEKKLSPFARSIIGQRYVEAKKLMPIFSRAVERIANEVGAEFKLGPLKSLNRIVEKTIGQLRGNPGRVVDLLRATVLVESPEQLRALDASIRRHLPVDTRNKRENLLRQDLPAAPDGYRDYRINFRMGNQLVELQAMPKSLMEAKETRGHKIFETRRSILSKAAAENRALTPEELTTMKAMDAESTALYTPIVRDFLSNSRASSRASLMSSPNLAAETSVPFQAGSSPSLRGGSTSQASTSQLSASTETGTPSTSYSFRATKPSVTQGFSKESVARIAQPIVSKWPGVRLRVVANTAELPQAVRQQLGNDRIQGASDAQTGEIWLVADQLKKYSDVSRVLTHEAVGHFAAKNQLGKWWNQALSDITRLQYKDAQIRKIYEKVDSTYEPENAEVRAAEVLARLSETSPRHPLVTRVLSQMKEWLRGLGLKLQFSRAELQGLLQRAARSLTQKPPLVYGNDKPESAREAESVIQSWHWKNMAYSKPLKLGEPAKFNVAVFHIPKERSEKGFTHSAGQIQIHMRNLNSEKEIAVFTAAINDLLDAGMPAMLPAIGVVDSPMGGLYRPLDGELYLEQALVGAAEMQAETDPLTAQVVRNILAHEIGHHVAALTFTKEKGSQDQPEFRMAGHFGRMVDAMIQRGDENTVKIAKKQKQLLEGVAGVVPQRQEGAVFAEMWAHYLNEGALSDLLGYPLDSYQQWLQQGVGSTGIGEWSSQAHLMTAADQYEGYATTSGMENFTANELFAQAHMLYWTQRPLMQEHLPKSYEYFTQFFKGLPKQGTLFAAPSMASEVRPPAPGRVPKKRRARTDEAGPSGGVGAGAARFFAARPSGDDGVHAPMEGGGGTYSTKTYRKLSPQAIGILRGAVDQFSPAIEDQRRGSRSWDETERAALAMIQNQFGITLDGLVNRKPGTASNAEQLHAYATLLAEGTAEVEKIAQKANETQSNEDLVALLAAVDRLGVVLAPTMGAATEAGRALNILNKLAPLGKGAKALVESIGGGTREDLISLAKALTSTDSRNQLLGMVKIKYKPTIFDKIFEIWINGLLSGPTTHMVNIASSGLYQALESGIEGVAAMTSSAVTARQLAARLSAMTNGVTLGLVNARKAFVEEAPQLSTRAQVEARHAMGGEVGSLVRVPTRLLTAEDEFWKGIAYNMELAQLAMQRAEQVNPQNPKESFNRIMGAIDNYPDLIRGALDAADKLTFTRELGELGHMVTRLRNKAPGFRYLMPFVRTPANIIKSTLEYTPLAPALSEVRADLMRGGRPRAQALARIYTGSGLMLSIAALAMQGLLTGAGPADPSKRQLMYRTGWQPYSFKVGGQWIRYNRFEPVGLLFGLAADLYELGGNVRESESGEVASLLIASLALNLADKTYLKGVTDFVEALSNPQEAMGRWAAGLAGSVVPAGVAQTARGMDPLQREARNIVDSIRARIPVEREKLAERIDLGGDPIKQTQLPMLPIQASQVRQDTLAETMLSLNMLKRKPDREQYGVKLDDDEYEEFARYVGQARWRVLTPFVQSPQFKQLSVSRPELAKELLDRQWEEVSRAARMAWITQHPEILARRDQVVF